MLTITGKKTITATIVTRGRRLSGPNQLSVIGAKAMIGIGAGADRDREQDLARARPAGGGEPGSTVPSSDAHDEPADRLRRR